MRLKHAAQEVYIIYIGSPSLYISSQYKKQKWRKKNYEILFKSFVAILSQTIFMRFKS